MREIKFRAWDKVEKTLLDVTLINFEYGLVETKIKHPSGVVDTNLRDIEEIELLEFTGLHDKNGTEIYEGDILKALMVTGKGTDLARRKNVEFATKFFEVDYIQGAFLLQGLNIHKNILMNCLFIDKDYYKERIGGSAHYKVESENGVYYRFDDFEKVGTIFENPELLEASD